MKVDEKKKPFVVLVLVLAIIAALLFIFKNQLLPNPNLRALTRMDEMKWLKVGSEVGALITEPGRVVILHPNPIYGETLDSIESLTGLKKAIGDSKPGTQVDVVEVNVLNENPESEGEMTYTPLSDADFQSVLTANKDVKTFVTLAGVPRLKPDSINTMVENKVSLIAVQTGYGYIDLIPAWKAMVKKGLLTAAFVPGVNKSIEEFEALKKNPTPESVFEFHFVKVDKNNVDTF